MSEITVELSPKHPMHLACDTESKRLALTGVLIEPHDDTDVICAATNGRILAVVKEEGTCKEPVIAPGDCFKAKKGQSLNVVKNGRWEKHAWSVKRGAMADKTTSVLADVEGRFPRYRDVLPSIECGRTLAVSIDPQLLLDLATALGRRESDKDYEDNRAITLLIPVFTKPDDEAGMPHSMDADTNGIACVVEGGGIGVIMPCRAGIAGRGDDPIHSSQRAYYTEFVKSLGETPKPV